jgi:hypothetical protein
VIQWNKIISVFLLFVFAAAIVPAESFHQHEEHTVVCKEQSTHIEEVHFECELCDFTLPVFVKKQQSRLFSFVLLSFKLSDLIDFLRIKDNYNTAEYRGPPLLA